MAYQSLARKYRPSRFADLVGQEATVAALQNAIRLDKEPHCVLFAGVRGIGKTTLARLYAKAVNCTQRQDSDPCGQCESCLAITRGSHEDVLEIDGASHTGVEDVRLLQETLGYVPQRSRFKVYIIDEVHMLSQSAFNALLKTLEEPPDHIIFLMATTELQKVPATILSRLVTFHLQSLAPATITGRLGEILQQEGIPWEEAALALIAREGRGSMRDALTLLDQVIALGAGEVRPAALQGLVTALSAETWLAFLHALVQKDRQTLLDIIAGWDQSGISMARAVEETARCARHGFVLQAAGDDALDLALLGLSEGERQLLRTICADAGELDLNRIFRTLVRCRDDLSGSGIDRFILENYALEYCLDPGLPRVEELLASSTTTSRAPSEQGQGVAPAPAVRQGASLRERFQAMQPDRPPAAPGPSRTSAPAPAPASAPPPAPAQTTPSSPLSKSGPVSTPAPPHPAEVDSSAAPESKPALPPEPAAVRAMPESWRGVVDIWRAKKPLKARMLEEALLVRYSAAEIVVSIQPGSMAASRLLQVGEQQQIATEFRQMFGFTGQFRVVAAEEGEGKPAAIQEESILAQRMKEKSAAREQLVKDMRDHTITKEALAQFNGKVEDIRLSDQ